MKKVTDFLGKPVLSLYESTTEGIVKDLVFDKAFKKLKFIVLFTDNEFQEEKIVSVNDIYSYGENALILKNNSCLDLKTNLTDELSSPINNFVYTTLGKFVGTVQDVNIDDKNNIISVLLTNNQTIMLDKIVTSGKDAMFIQDETKEVKLANFKKRQIVNVQENKAVKVEILQVPETISEVTDNETVQTPLEVEQVETLLNDDTTPIKPRKKIVLDSNNLPKRSTTKDNFLIGRKVEKNIYSFNHELIIRKNTRITEKTIVIAKSHSKFKELTLYSK